MKKLTKMFLMLLAIGTVAFGMTGCGEKSSSGGSGSSSSSSGSVDESDPKAVVKKFAALMGEKKFNEAQKFTPEGSDFSAWIGKFESKIKEKNEKYIGLVDVFKKIGNSFDSLLENTEQDGDKITYTLKEIYFKHMGKKESVTIVVMKVDGKYRVDAVK